MDDNETPNYKKKKLRPICNDHESDEPEMENGKRNSYISEVEEKPDNVRKKIEEVSNPDISYWQLYRFATTSDWFCIFIAVLCTIVAGTGKQYFFVIYGDVTGSFITYASAMSRSNLTKNEEKNAAEVLYHDIFIQSMFSIGLGVIILLCQYAACILFSYSSLRQVFKIRQKFLEKTLNQDIGWYDLNKTGDFATTFSENLTKIEEGIGEKVGVFIFYQVIWISGFTISIIYGWELGLIAFAPLPLSSLVMAIITWFSNKFSKQEMESYSQAGSIAEEVFSAIRTVAAFDGFKKEQTRYEKHLIDAKKNNIRRSLFSGISNGFLWLIFYGSCAISTWYGVQLIIREKGIPLDERKYSPAIVVTIFFNTLIAFWYFSMGAPYLQIFGTACGAASKVFKVLDNEPIINASLKKGLKLENLKGNISFENIFFRYPSRPEVKILNGLSLKINAGETVAFVGSSGCGKSTCIQLVQRFYDPISGEITVDGNDIKNFDLKWLRSKIGVVAQEPILFATTIAENIRYGNLSASQEDIEKATKKAQVHNFIKSLPNGYETIIGERGTQLSGGQKQRIAIARALIRKPSILLLDEATSALDATSEAEVQAALDSVLGQCTTIIVAHRLSTVRNADKIFVFNEGKIVEYGNYQQLMTEEGAFYKLVKSQAPLTDETSFEESSELVTKVPENTKVIYDRKESFVDINKLKHRKSITEEKNEKSNFLEILKMNKPEWFWILIGCATSVLIGATLPTFSVLFGDMVAVFSIENEGQLEGSINSIFLFYMILGVASGLSYLLQMYAFGVAGENLTLRVRSKIFAVILKQEIGYFDREENGVGSLCSKLSSDASAIQGASGLPIATILNSLTTLILCNALGIYFQWNLALVLLCFFPLIFVAVYYEQKLLLGLSEYREKKLLKSSSIAVEAIRNIRTVVSLGCENLFLSRYNEELTPYIVSSKRNSHFRGFILGLASSLWYFAYAAGFNYGARLVVEEHVHYGIIFKVTELVVAGSWAMGNTFAFAPNFQSGLEAAGRMFKLFRRVPDVKNISNASKRKWDIGNLELSKLYFSYPTRPDIPILNGLNLNIFPGKTVALVGSSGCGKSTIIQLLERFYDPASGEICVDDVDIKTMDLQHLRSNFGIVSQEPNLFDRTIAENIAYGNNLKEVPMNEIIEAAKSANIHNFISSLPKGYDTSLGTKGTQLSGGQKQRIAIARALVRNPKILLLDEATSALDNESEKIVQEALDKAKEGRTCITIAHRLSTIQDADVICVFDKGKIVEIGKHNELLERKGHYYHFCKSQSGH